MRRIDFKGVAEMSRALIPALTAAIAAIVLSFMAATPDAVVCEPPAVDLGEISGYASSEVDISEAELNILPADTRIEKRLYAADGYDFLVSAVIGGKSKSSIHRPELCLPSQGFLMSNPHTEKVGGVEWRILSVGSAHGGALHGFAYTFFNQSGMRTSSHFKRILADVWDRSVNNRIDRWVMITVYASDPAALTGFLAKISEVVK